MWVNKTLQQTYWQVINVHADSWKCQDLMTLVCDQYRVLVLRRKATVCCDNGPLVLPHPPLSATLCKHRLYGERLACCHNTTLIVPGMWYHWSRMECPANSMTHKLSHNTVLVLVCYAMYHLNHTLVFSHMQRQLS